MGRFWPAFHGFSFEERLVWDVLGGAGVLYGLWWIPLPLATPWTVGAVVGTGTLGLLWLGRCTISTFGTRLRGTFPHVLPVGIVAGLALLLLGLEASVATTQPAGNTLDAANDVLWTALLLNHGHFVLSAVPYVSYPVYPPQGITVWSAVLHWTSGVPIWASPNESGPLFQALLVPAAAALGRRWFGGSTPAIAFAALFALLFAWPKLLVEGSYDFVAALPPTLLLLPHLGSILEGRGPRAAPALPVAASLVLFGVTYSPVPFEAALVGALLVGMVLCVVPPIDVGRGLGRVGAIVLLGIVGALAAFPSFVSLLGGPGHGASAVAGPAQSVSLADLEAYLDPFLFGPGDLWVSPLLALHVEVVLLLIAGLLLLLFAEKVLPSSTVRRGVLLLAPPLVGTVALLLLMSAPDSVLYSITNASELALTYGIALDLLACLPLALCLEWGSSVHRNVRPSRAPRSARGLGSPSPLVRGLLIVLVVALVLLPPLVETASAEPSYMDQELASVSTVTPTDLAMLRYVGSLPPGTALVAPGSAAEYLPAFSSDPLCFPLIGLGGGIGFQAGIYNGTFILPFHGPAANATYLSIVDQLVTGNLSAAAPGELALLHVTYVLVTGPSTGLFPPFLPRPLLSDPSVFRLDWEAGADYVFTVVPA